MKEQAAAAAAAALRSDLGAAAPPPSAATQAEEKKVRCFPDPPLTVLMFGYWLGCHALACPFVALVPQSVEVNAH